MKEDMELGGDVPGGSSESPGDWSRTHINV